MATLPTGFPPPTEIGVIEIKSYPEYRAVTYTYRGEPQSATHVAFDPLFQHISQNQIAMTVPVEARYIQVPGQSEVANLVKVSFLYPDQTINPQQIAENVEVIDYPRLTVVSIGVGGAYTWKSYLENLHYLRQWLNQNPQYQILGNPRRLLYNSPMTPESLKHSEVQIPLGNG